MKIGAVLGGLCALVVSIGVVVALMSPPRTKTTGALVSAIAGTDDARPPVSKSGPWPKAVMEETEYNFGRMEVGEEQSHEFVIENRGDVPLIVKQGPSTCQCTVSKLESGELAPGASAKVTLTWKPTVETEQFGKGSDLYTNDPEYRTIHLRIQGVVAARVITVPSKNWEAPDVQENAPTEIAGGIMSAVVDKFEIVGFETKSPLVTAAAFPLSEDKLSIHKALCGYEIRVSIKPEMPVGAFKIPLTVKTNMLQRDSQGDLTKPVEVDVLISGHRRGPIQIIGKEWIAEKMAIALGSFDAGAGKKLTLPMFIHGAPRDLVLAEPAECEPADLKVTFEADERWKGARPRFLLTVEYPPGAPRIRLWDENPATVKLRFNYPGAEQMNLGVYLNAY